MEAIKGIFDKVDQLLSSYLQPVIDKITQFLGNGAYTVIAVIALFAGLLILIGLFRWLRKAPKLFFFLVFVFGLVVVVWHFWGK